MNKGKDTETVRRIIDRYHRRLGGLVSILHEIQQTYGYLPADALRLTADLTGTSLVDIYAIATFHNSFTVKPPSGPDMAAEDASPHATSVRCRSCNHSLTDSKHAIGGRPSVRVTVAFGSEHGWFRLACTPRLYDVESEYPFPTSGEVNFFCPHCHAQLFPADNCEACGAPLVPMLADGGTLTTVCSSRECRLHRCSTQDGQSRL